MMLRKALGLKKKDRGDGRQPTFQEDDPPASSSNIARRATLDQQTFDDPTESLPPLSTASTFASLPPRRKSDQSVTPSVFSRRPTELFLKKGSDTAGRSEPDHGPLGLSVVYTPQTGHKADIVFIHGLGGSGQMSWSKDRDPELFWPLKFLPLEPDICLARVLSFSYNANFRRAGNVNTSVLDFAKDLLFDLRYGKDEQMKDLNMGSVPLIFVVHSMGGLIIKEAYMQGYHDENCESIVKAISAIIFLSTPHRGTNLAETLNRILQSSFVTNSKQYISDLARNSFTLQKLNEQFRHIAPRLDIVSFYETQPTSIGLKKARVMVLEKESSVLGYPGEVSKALDADHHSICKYDSRTDDNYVSVRNALKSLVSNISSSTNSKRPQLSSRKESRDLKTLLAITELPDVDYTLFRDQWTEGTGNWILEDDNFLPWVNAQESTHQIAWVNGGPGTGKSVLSSFIINTLVEQELSCQYFFIRYGDQKKRTLNLILRSVAFQLAQSMPRFAERVIELVDEAIDFENTDPRIIWERIFKSTLFEMRDEKPIFWIIDGLDEAEDPKTVVRILSDIKGSSIPIRILFTGRMTSDLATAFKKIPEELNVKSISIEGHAEDLSCYIRQELSTINDDDFAESVVQELLERSENNFLWVRHVVQKLNSCHTHAAVKLALQEVPTGMDALYDRMATVVAEHSSPADQTLASIILQCVTCSLRVLTVAELSQALGEDTSTMLDFQRSIVDLCGGFVFIDNGGNVAMIHQTAREYLLTKKNRPFHIDSEKAHKQMYLSCIRCLTIVDLRAKLKRSEVPEFLDYAATSWATHLRHTPLADEQVLGQLKTFLTRNWALTWVYVLANGEHLGCLVQTAKQLSRYSSKRREFYETQDDGDPHIVDVEIFECWAIDLIKIVGKFGAVLRRNPEAIYKSISPFCPKNSMMYQYFGKTEVNNLKVSGFSTENWDDSLARLSLPLGNYASSISAAGTRIALLANSGSIFIYDSLTFEELAASPIKHGERLYRMEMNSAGTLLATYGFRTTKIWDTVSGQCKTSVQNVESKPRPLAIRFTNNSTMLYVGSDDRRLRSLDLKADAPTWQLLAEFQEPEHEDKILNAPNQMALNKNGSLIAVAHRLHPLSVWETDGPEHIGYCWRKREEMTKDDVVEVVWHPHDPEVLGLYYDGVVFKWRPYTDESAEVSTGASKLTMSRDGELFATGDAYGTVKVYTVSDFSLLYRLASQDSVFAITFSPDLRRLYDVRGYYGNAWEPTALIKYADDAGKESDGDSSSLGRTSTTSTTVSQNVDPITVVSASPLGRLYCYGTEKGTVRLYDTQRGNLGDIYTSKGFLSVERMTWSDDGQLLCFSDAGKKVFIMSIAGTQPGSGVDLDQAVKEKAQISMKTSTKGSILQLLFHPDSICLLVRTASKVCVISLASSSVTKSLDLDTTGCHWKTHPRDPALIIGVGSSVLQVLDWDLNKVQTVKLDTASQGDQTDTPESTPIDDVVDRVVVTQDKKHLLVQTSSRAHKIKKSLLYFDLSQLANLLTVPQTDDSQATEPVQIKPTIISPDVTAQIAAPLSFLFHDRLIYLSRTSSICSLQLSPSVFAGSLSVLPTLVPEGDTTSLHKPLTTIAGKDGRPINDKYIKELFSLPGDWISSEAQSLCSIWNKERSLLYPRNGELAVVRSMTLAR